MPQAGELFIGLMSGTSVDGIDAALVEFKSSTELSVLATLFTPFDDALRREINSLAQSNSALLHRADSSLHDRLAQNYAAASLALVEQAGVSTSQLSGIANHGQTVRHEPNASPAFSLQLGNPQIIANLTGVTTYGQFRQADLAAGGQGAPLMPAFHSAVFGGNENNFILNIGGIANLSQLGEKVLGFDTGPGNTLMDQWILKVRGERYDKDGEWARSGKVIPELLTQLLSEPYFSFAAPKSTGPDYFNLAWLGPMNMHRPQDVQATLLALTVDSIAQQIKLLSCAGDKIYVCGGGTHNQALMLRLTKALPGCSVDRTDALGVPSDWVEAAGFAWLGYCCAHRIESNIPSVTGADESVVLGEVFSPAQSQAIL
ncbi:MAG: anhydro-N-acetylmuramic acid kinase [Cryomorphaceae bacterium]|jgi:anhydro-N-acetylmuramic acid kinase